MKNLKFAFVKTIPILLSYIFLGIAFGILLQASGYGWGFALIISLTVFTGAFQFILVGLMAGSAGLGTIAITALLINSRNLFYGFPFIRDFKRMGWKYPFMIHAMSDETFALLTSTETPADLDRDKVRFFIAGLNFCYWAIGSTLGGLLGNIMPFDLTGIDFCMTALFLTIFLDQWKAYKSHLPALLGFVSAALCLLIVGPRYFLLPALIVTVAGLLVLRPRIEEV